MTDRRCAGRQDQGAPSDAPVAVLLPGTGSDEVFVTAAFRAALTAVGIRLHAPPPVPGAQLVPGYRQALERAAGAEAADGAPLLVGGVSLGAQVAVHWAAEHRERLGERLRGLLLVMPAWTDDPADAPAARAARASAAAVRADGVAATLAAVRAGAPAWLADELGRSWPRYGDGLADALAAGGSHHGPGLETMRRLDMPVGLVGVRDDPVHPLGVAQQWHAALRRSALILTTLGAIGADPATLGRTAVLALLLAGYS